MTSIFPSRATRDLTMTTLPAPQAQVTQARQHQLFSPQVESELAQSDHEAWTAVCSILITIVSLGLILGIGGVLLTL